MTNARYGDKYAELFFDYYSRLKRVEKKIELTCSRENEQTDNSTKISRSRFRAGPFFNETRRFNFRGV